MSFRFALLLVAAGSLVWGEDARDPRVRQAERLIWAGKFLEAAAQYENLYRQAVASGVDDGNVAEAAADLASTYIWLDRYQEAELLLHRALDIDRRVFGPDGRLTARHSVSLVKLYALESRQAEGAGILARVRPIIEREYGADSTTMATVLNDLGLIEDAYGRLHEAGRWYRRAIAVYAGMGEGKRGLMAMVMVNLVPVLVAEGSTEEAAATAARAVQLLEQAYGDRHPFTARAYTALGWIHQLRHQPEQARAWYERSLAIWDENPEVGAVNAAVVEVSLGCVYTDLGYYPKAEALLQRALKIRELLQGPDTEEIIGVLNNLGVLYARQKRLTEAIAILERGVKLAESAPPRSLAATPLLVNLGSVYFQEAQYRKEFYAKADAMFRRVLSMEEQRYGPDHLAVASALINLAQTCAAEKHYREAKQLEGRAVAIRQAVLGPRHPDTLLAAKQYALLLRKRE